MSDDHTTGEKRPRTVKLLTEVDVMRKIEALIDELTVPAQSRIIDYFTSVVRERAAHGETHHG